ncbi:sulfur transporter [Nitzschia inconspicua]|uniref:Sulfur transporter n=1 Tax=Nitzschia inconspicua TaxID=303405 RepID=A0A9K3KXJ2_9STRA|nr:sulfur transporter [Nitzschia inconspicua]
MSLFDYFTPLTGSIGGTMIGLSSGVLLLMNGDVLGASGIMATFFTNPIKALKDPKNLWRMALMTTFLVTSALCAPFAVDRVTDPTLVALPSPIAYSLAGLLVGFGTRLGNGCTSGHGVCGLGRRSTRSLAAVMTFMATGVATAMGLSPSAPWSKATAFLRSDTPISLVPALGYAAIVPVVLGLLVMPKLWKKESFTDEDKEKVFGGALSGILFGAGLGISGMVLPSKLNLFLNMGGIANGTWDPTLMTVLGAAVPVSFLAYQFVPKFSLNLFGENAVMKKPLMTEAFNLPTNNKLDWNIIIGEAIFGIGWAIGSLCPGPAMFHVAVGNPMVIFGWMPGFIVGAILAQEIKAKQH